MINMPAPGAKLEKVLTLGDPRLRKPAKPVSDLQHPQVQAEIKCLHGVLNAFREKFGFGRAIAAPQLGIMKQIIALNLDGNAFTMINPRISWQSQEMFSLWDDCMSFPDLFVRVSRHESITVEFQDPDGESCLMEKVDRARSELFQHEIDHLRGILAVDRAENSKDIVYRTAFQANPRFFREKVDYAIGE